VDVEVRMPLDATGLSERRRFHCGQFLLVENANLSGFQRIEPQCTSNNQCSNALFDDHRNTTSAVNEGWISLNCEAVIMYLA
jgi:hypothetical protein